MLHAIHLSSQVGDHAEHAVPENPESIIYSIILAQNLFYANFQVPTSPSCAIVKDPFPRNFANINSYFYVLRQYSTYSLRQGSIRYPNHASVLVYRDIPLKKTKRDS